MSKRCSAKNGNGQRCGAASRRQRKGWTQTDMVFYLDMNRGHISDIERGKQGSGRNESVLLTAPSFCLSES
jgi:transcriptional regulator with XRE-family HTH domain